MQRKTKIIEHEYIEFEVGEVITAPFNHKTYGIVAGHAYVVTKYSKPFIGSGIYEEACVDVIDLTSDNHLYGINCAALVE